MDGKIRHRPKTFMGVQDSILPFSSSNLSNNGEVRTCPTAQTLFGFQLISWVLEIQMSSGFFCWKAETISHSFHGTKGSNSDVSNDVLASQQYQEPAANNIKNLPTISRTSSQQCQKPATKSMVAYQSIVLNLSL